MLETEIKKLREAVEANTAALLGQGQPVGAEVPTAQPHVEATAPATPAAPAGAPGAPGAVAPGSVAPPLPGAPTSAAPPTAGTVPGTSAPAAPAPGGLDHAGAQQRIAAKMQALGDQNAVLSIMQKYGWSALTQVPAEHLEGLVAEIEALQ